MSHTEIESKAPAAHPPAVPRTVPDNEHPKPGRTTAKRVITWSLLLAAVAGVAYGVKAGRIVPSQVLEQVKRQLPMHLITPKLDPAGVPIQVAPSESWNGMVPLLPKEQEAIGLRLARVEAQTEPLKLSLTGRTAYDENSLTRIRPRFDTLVEKVYASRGQRVKKGDPLVDLYSIELAKAKTDYQTKYVQWQHDLKLYNLYENLIKAEPPAVSQQQLVDRQIEENKSRLDYIAARDNLGILGVPNDEVTPLIKGLDASDKNSPIPYDNLQIKAKMTLRSPADGIVIEREVVPGNLYNDTFVLMVIAPLDHLFVWVNAYERDQAKVAKGQKLEILFPYLEQRIKCTVEYVSSEVSKDTRAVKIRASIPNREGQLKAEMLVKAWLEIAPVAGQTVIPRLAMVVANGSEYVFVRKGGGTSRENTADFERRLISVVQEGSEDVVVGKGLKAGEEVATNGSLILAQLFEDRQIVDTGLSSK